MALFNSMSLRGKLTLAGCALAFIAASLFLVKMAGKPSYATVMTGVDPAKTAQITSALTAAGVSYELQNGGTAVAVKKGQETQANVALATKGLNTTSTQPGFEILDKQKLGASSQQQQVAYQRGLEGEIANTIGQISGAQGARVNLTLGQDNLFADESQPATAAVLIPTDATGMDPASVKGIANLVASAVPNLKPANVTITDGSGTMLWPNGDSAGGDGSTGLPNKTAAEARYNTSVEADLQSLLDRTLGPNKAQVEVHSDLNVDKTDLQSVTYDPKKVVPLQQQKDTETLKGTGSGTAAGTTGTASNSPNQVAAGTNSTGSGNSDYKKTSTNTTNGVDKTITKTTKAPGAVNRMDVAVLLDKSVPLKGAALTSLQNSLASAAGLQIKQRGDTLNVTQGLTFAPVAAAPKAGGPIPAAFSGILKGVGIGLGALIFLFFVTRHLRKRERGELIDEPSWLKSLEASQPQAELMPMPTFDPQAAATEVSIATADPRRQHLDNIIHDEPERVAAHLRSWITEDNK
jgi:flagellar M-ring protein FliF